MQLAGENREQFGDRFCSCVFDQGYYSNGRGPNSGLFPLEPPGGIAPIGWVSASCSTWDIAAGTVAKAPSGRHQCFQQRKGVAFSFSIYGLFILREMPAGGSRPSFNITLGQATTEPMAPKEKTRKPAAFSSPVNESRLCHRHIFFSKVICVFVLRGRRRKYRVRLFFTMFWASASNWVMQPQSSSPQLISK